MRDEGIEAGLALLVLAVIVAVLVIPGGWVLAKLHAPYWVSACYAAGFILELLYVASQ